MGCFLEERNGWKRGGRVKSLALIFVLKSERVKDKYLFRIVKKDVPFLYRIVVPEWIIIFLTMFIVWFLSNIISDNIKDYIAVLLLALYLVFRLTKRIFSLIKFLSKIEFHNDYYTLSFFSFFNRKTEKYLYSETEITCKLVGG